MTPRRHNGRVALVTGAAAGIGRATAVRLAEEGARVLCVDLDGRGAAATAAAIGDAATSAAADVADEDAVADVVERSVTWAGRLDVLANVAGTGGSVVFEDLTLQEWERTLSVNLTGTFLLCRAAMPHLLATRGAVVNVASIAGLRGRAFSAAYCASKGGVVLLTRALAVEFASRGVRVNCVCPGGVETAMVDRFRLPEGADRSLVPSGPGFRPRRSAPEEIAAAIAYLASDEAASVVGETFVVDGGASAG